MLFDTGPPIVKVDPLSITRSAFATVAPGILLATLSPTVSVTVGANDALNVTFIFPVTHNCPRFAGNPEKVTMGEPEAALNIARSPAIGTDAPEAPPDATDQFDVPDQKPSPPVTQYLVSAYELRANAFKTTNNSMNFKTPLKLYFGFAFFLSETLSLSSLKTKGFQCGLDSIPKKGFLISILIRFSFVSLIVFFYISNK
jgi:hypothetical protein